MKSKKIIPDIQPKTNFNNIVEDIKHLSIEGQQKVMKLIEDISEEETTNKRNDDTIHYCLRCGKPLKQSNSIHHNMGPVCYKRYCEEQNKKTKTLF